MKTRLSLSLKSLLIIFFLGSRVEDSAASAKPRPCPCVCRSLLLPILSFRTRLSTLLGHCFGYNNELLAIMGSFSLAVVQNTRLSLSPFSFVAPFPAFILLSS